MVKGTSYLVSTEMFRVRLLVGVLGSPRPSWERGERNSPVVQWQDSPLTWGRSVVRVHPGLLRVTEGLADGQRHPVGSRSSTCTALRVRLPLLPLSVSMVSVV